MRLRPLLFVLPILTACPGPDPDPTPQDPAWTVPVEGVGGALLSVLEHQGDIFVSGTNGGDGGTVLRLHDGQWTSETTGTNSDLWWIAAHPDGTLYVVGEAGTVLHRDADGNYSALEVSTDLTLYGVWFDASGTGWVAGGEATADGISSPRGVLLKIEGGNVSVETAVPDLLEQRMMFKVWGPPDQSGLVYAVGEQGYLLEYDGSTWQEVDSGTNSRLVTMAGDESRRAIVGGASGPTFLLDEGEGLVDVSAELPVGAQGLNGVFMRDDQLAVVGNLGYAAMRDADGAWTSEYVGDGWLHAVTIDADGELWAVGGDLLALKDGYVAHYGTRDVPGLD